MPIDARKSISSNIEEIMRSYKEKGKIGNITPKSKGKAAKIASAIAYRAKREKNG